ncbi:restriction endonuclease subunit S [Flavobacterium sp. HXWNR29]|uniref:restriction endonuclease subunit S n=1 Tax=Flavobacterium odoriferum TaxID=2946604 RepID=UPI0021CAF653|nr:restriction endonuclease subunit S [Flavobacterium sp. HXWNR29]MCU4190064.1 restriction endonuclease subunit S [Flavobacterium sp. HXWNR29]
MRNDMNWENKKLGEVYDVRDGTHDSPKYIEVGYPLVTSKNLKNGEVNFEKVKFISDTDFININKRSKVDKGDVLFAMIGTIGNPTLITEEPNYAIKNVALFKVGKEQNGQYLKYYLESDSVVSKMLEDAKGTTQKFVGLGYLRSFEIPIPTLEEQKAIVAKLDQAFAAIDQAKANIEKNIANAKELFQSKLNQIFSQKAEGWEERTLQELCEKITDGSHNPPKGVEKSSYLMLSSKNVFDDSINFSNPRYLTKEDFISENKRTDVKENDVLLTIVGTIGRVAVVPRLDNYFVLQRSVAVLKPIPTEINSRFLKYTLRNAIVYLQENSRGVAQKGIYLNQLKQINLFIPNLLLQQQIVTQLDQLQEQTNLLVTKYQQKLANLEELKKSILEKAFKGELV